MSFRKQKHVQNFMPDPSVIAVPIYTRESVKRSLDSNGYNQSDFYELVEGQYDGYFDSRIADALNLTYGSSYTPSTIPIIKFGVIDDEYYEWLCEKKDTSATRTEYILSLNEEKATELLIKHKKHGNYQMFFLPFILAYENGIATKETHFLLTAEQRKKVERFFKVNFPASEIYVSEYFLTGQDALDNMEDIYQLGVDSLLNGIRIKKTRYETQRHSTDKLTIVSIYLPILIGSHIKSAWIDPTPWFVDDGSELTSDEVPDCVMLDTETDITADIPRAKIGLNESGLNDIFKSIFQTSFMCGGTLIEADSVQYYQKELLKELKKQAKKNHIPFRTF